MFDRRVKGGAKPPAVRQDLHVAMYYVVKQRTLALDLGAARLAAVRNALPVEDQAYIRSVGGAGAFLDGPVTMETMNLWQTAARYRLGMAVAAYEIPPTQPCDCHYRTSQGHRCVAQLDMDDTHHC